MNVSGGAAVTSRPAVRPSGCPAVLPHLLDDKTQVGLPTSDFQAEALLRVPINQPR